MAQPGYVRSPTLCGGAITDNYFQGMTHSAAIVTALDNERRQAENHEITGPLKRVTAAVTTVSLLESEQLRPVATQLLHAVTDL